MASPTYPANVEAVEQQTLAVAGTHSRGTTAAVKTAVGASNTYLFNAAYDLWWNNHHLHFKGGTIYVLDAALKARLLAMSAPMVLA